MCEVQAFLPIFVYKQSYENTFHGKPFRNNEFDFVYLVVFKERIPIEQFKLQSDEVEEVRYINYDELYSHLEKKDAQYVDAYDVAGKVKT